MTGTGLTVTPEETGAAQRMIARAEGMRTTGLRIGHLHMVIITGLYGMCTTAITTFTTIATVVYM
jgi:hypothetical protein